MKNSQAYWESVTRDAEQTALKEALKAAKEAYAETFANTYNGILSELTEKYTGGINERFS